MYQASSERYQSMQYYRSGNSGLKLPAISLGLWHNFGPASGSAEQMVQALRSGQIPLLKKAVLSRKNT